MKRKCYFRMNKNGYFFLLFFYLLSLQTEAKSILPSLVAEEKRCLVKKKDIDKINTLSVSNKLSRAISLAKKKYLECPKEDAFVFLYAKLLYWDAKLSKAYKVSKKLDTKSKQNRNLSNKISQAYHIKSLKNAMNNPKIFLKKEQELSSSEQFNYDVMQLRVSFFVRHHMLREALKSAKKFYKTYQKSEEAVATLAKLYFWNKHYKDSLSLYQRLYKKYPKEIYNKKILMLKKIIYDNYLSQTNTTLTGLLEKRNFKKMKKLFHSIEDSDRFKKRYPDTYCKVNSVYMVGVGGNHFTQKNQNYKDQSQYIEAVFPIGKYVLYSKIEDVKRYGLDDRKISGELYPILPDPYWGYLSFSKTFNATFLSDYSLGLHLFYEKKLRYGLGITMSKYDTGTYFTFAPEYAYYINDYLIWRQVLYYTPKSKSYSILNQLHYETPCHSDYQLNYTYGNTNELSDDQTSFIHQKVHTLEIGVEHAVGDGYTLGGKATFQVIKNISKWKKKKGFDFFIRRYW